MIDKDVSTNNAEEKGLPAKTDGKAGYRQTKLGWIPEGWEIVKLGEIGEFSKGKGIAKRDVLENGIHGFPCIRYAEIYTDYNYYSKSFSSRINEESAKNSNTISYGDILFAGSGETLEDIGKSIAYLGHETAYAGGDIIILKQKTHYSHYLGYLLNNDIVRNQLFKIGQGHSVVHIYSSGLKKVLISLPPLPEQQKIAQILSTWDKAIAVQEKLIAEKQKLKKGLMQQLLTGKKRFPGFTEEWEVKTISEIASKIGDGLHSTPKYQENGTYKFINGNNLVDNKIRITENTKSINQEEFLKYKKPLNDRTILLSINGTIGNIAFYNDEPVTLGKSAAFINIIKDVSKEHIAFQLQTAHIINHFKKVATGSTIKNLGLKAISTTKIFLPSIMEQKKIVEVLKGSEKEIKSMQIRLQSLKVQKQGLMQQLLTGEKRVKI